MEQIPVKFNSLRDGKNIVHVALQCQGDVLLICGRYIVNAKSILGIFSLPQFNGVKLQVECDNVEELKRQMRKLDILDE